MIKTMNSPESTGNGVSTKTLSAATRQVVRGGLMSPGAMESTPPTRPSEPESFDPSVLLHSLRRRWPLALLLGLILGPPLAAVAWFLLVPKFAAVAYLRIDSENAPLIFQTADREVGRGTTFDLYKNTQVELLRTPFVLNKALADEQISRLPVVQGQEDAYQWLSGALGITFPNKGEVMLIELETPSAESSVLIVDAVVDAYMNESVLEDRNERLQRLNSLERVYAETEGKVRASRAEIRKLTDALGTSDSESLSVAQQMSIERYGQVQSELGKVSFELMRAQGELTTLQALSTRIDDITIADDRPSEGAGELSDEKVDEQEPALSEFEMDRLLDSDRAYQGLVTEKRQVDDRIALYRTQYGEGMIRPELAKLDRLKSEMSERADTLRGLALDQKRTQIAAGTTEAIDPRLSLAEQESIRGKRKLEEEREARANSVAASEIRVGVLKEQKSRIEEDLARLEADSKKLGRSSVDVEMMRAEIASLDEVLQRLSSEIERTKIELKSGSRVSVVSEATPLASSDAKKRYAATAGLGLMGFLFPFIAVVGLDARRKLVNDAESIGGEHGLTVLGSVPHDRNVTKQLSSGNFIEGDFGNSVSSIVAMLVNQSKFDDFNSLMVTSAVAGEGKSTVAQSLWQGLADANYRALLLDFDLRRPSVHVNLNVSMSAGIGDIIRGDATWEQVIHHCGENRDCILAGAGKKLNLAAAAHSLLPELFAEFRAQYDFVIVDTPPLLPIVDSRILGEQVDAAVLAVMKDRSRLPQVVAATEILKAHGTPLLGVVVSGCKSKAKDYGYYYE